tara:strand:- start:91 stop:294 length:204 start_codon:yes stop_codon:yes gene_type:complete
MTEDFYDHMKKEQEFLDLSYRESLRQKHERMAVWDPGEERAVFWEIKTFIIARLSGFKRVGCVFVPG